MTGQGDPSWRRGNTWRRRERTVEPFPRCGRGVARAQVCGVGGRYGVGQRHEDGTQTCQATGFSGEGRRRARVCVQPPSTIGCVGSAWEPPRPIPNRVVKRRSADATGGSPLGT
jgi:hypothetical protein